ncbi:hypothetical protein F5Y19DRAFT_459098 [Xylariaceae sp. FL1651]|nr:hypothetical protein F5Y19DRAFT_459098 [Xylariaceae sp. FL1651]
MPRHLKLASCNTCRQRKLKCDEGLPVCRRCAKARRYCDRSRRPLQLHVFPAHKDKNQELSADTPRKALESPEVTIYFQHYINNVARWYDLSDACSLFSTLVPLIALDEPLLFSAVIALSAIHKSKTNANSARSAAESFHAQCIRLLIGLDANDPLIERGVALATTCLLRSYEILDEGDDPNRHLKGAFSLVSQYHNLPIHPSNGLLASGFWNYLREDITFSLFGSCPLKIDLDPVPPLIQLQSDQDHLNSISLILGRIINVTVGGTTNIPKVVWKMLLDYVDAWYLNLHKQFQPFSRATVPLLSKLPSVHMLSSCHAAARHYLLVSYFLLTKCLPSLDQLNELRILVAKIGIGAVDVADKEDLLEQIALEICGISFASNEPAVLVNAFGPISFCARHIRSEPTQQEVIRHLLASQKSTGWPIQQIIMGLQGHWGRGGAREFERAS